MADKVSTNKAHMASCEFDVFVLFFFFWIFFFVMQTDLVLLPFEVLSLWLFCMFVCRYCLYYTYTNDGVCNRIFYLECRKQSLAVYGILHLLNVKFSSLQFMIHGYEYLPNAIHSVLFFLFSFTLRKLPVTFVSHRWLSISRSDCAYTKICLHKQNNITGMKTQQKLSTTHAFTNSYQNLLCIFSLCARIHTHVHTCTQSFYSESCWCWYQMSIICLFSLTLKMCKQICNQFHRV